MIYDSDIIYAQSQVKRLEADLAEKKKSVSEADKAAIAELEKLLNKKRIELQDILNRKRREEDQKRREAEQKARDERRKRLA